MTTETIPAQADARTCPHCGDSLAGRGPLARFCSNRCRSVAGRKANPPARPVRERTGKVMPGERFGSLVVIEHLGSRKGSGRVLARCDCGTVHEFGTPNLLSGSTARCSDQGAHPDPRHGGQVLTYDGAHGRVKRERGSASAHPCVSCGRPARDWTYSHAAPSELAMAEGREAGRPYSASPEFYDPRCRPCHLRWDAAGRRLMEGHRPGSRSLVHVALWHATHPEEAAA